MHGPVHQLVMRMCTVIYYCTCLPLGQLRPVEPSEVATEDMYRVMHNYNTMPLLQVTGTKRLQGEPSNNYSDQHMHIHTSLYIACVFTVGTQSAEG